MPEVPVDPEFQHPPFKKSEREQRINAICAAITVLPDGEERQKAKSDLLDLIEGENRGA